MPKILDRIIKLTFAMIALVIGHDCLTLSKMFTFYVVYNYDTIKAVTKSLITGLSWTFRSGPYSGSRPLERA